MTGMPRAHAIRLRERDADEERPDEPRPLRHGNGIDVVRLCAPACASAASTTPQMSRTCWRDASSGTTPPHSRWMSVCEATIEDRMTPGPRGVAGFGDDRRRGLVARGLDREQVHGDGGWRIDVEGPFQGLAVGRPEDALLGDDAGDVAVRRHVERGIADVRALRASGATMPRCVTSRRSRSSIGILSPSGVARSTVESGAAT